MPVIYLKHPVHGVKVATMELEAAYDESNGWVRYNPEMPDFLQPTNVLNTRRKRRQPED